MDEPDQTVAEEFRRLHYLTMQLVKGHNFSIVRDLIGTIESTDKPALVFAKPYILSEIAKSLKIVKKPDLQIEMLRVAQCLLERTPGGPIQQSGLLITLTDLVTLDKPQPEELVMSILLCMNAISSKCPLELKRTVFIKVNAPFLGKSIYVATKIARKHSYSEIKLLALEYILNICSLDTLKLFDAKESKETKDKIADVLMFFLPGVVSACQEVALQGVSKTHKISVLALRIWGRMNALVMEDGNVAETVPTASDFLALAEEKPATELNPKKDWRKDGVSGIIDHLNSSARNSSWLKEASNKVASLLTFMNPLVTHDHPAVRQELVNSCQLILKFAWNNCGACKPHLLAMLFSLSQDSISTIANSSKDVLKDIIKCRSPRIVIRTIENKFHTSASDLPSLLNIVDERVLSSSLDFLIGVLQTLGEYEEAVFTPQTQERLLDVLATVIEVDVSSVPLDEQGTDVALSALDMIDHLCRNKAPPFRHINDRAEDILRKIEALCSFLGSSAQVNYLADILYSRMQNGDQVLESTILMKLILKTGVHSAPGICKDILHYWQYDNVWYLPVDVKPEKERGPDYKSIYLSDHTPGLYEGALEVRYTDVSDAIAADKEDMDVTQFCANLHEVKYNTILMSLQCEAVGNLALAMGDSFRPFFLKYLYLVIERCGHRKERIQASAFAAARNFQEYSGAKNLSELLDKNMDYLIHSISVKLNHIILYNAPDTGVLDVVAIVVEHCTDSAHLDSFADVVKKVEELNFKRGDVIISLLRVYRAFMKRLVVLYGPKSGISEQPAKSKEKKSLLEKLQELQKAYETERNITEEPEVGVDDDMECGDDIPDYNKDADEKIPPPDYVTLAASILKRSVPFVSSNHDSHRLLALDIIQAGLPLLSIHEDTLLPALHEAWDPVALRMRGRSESELKVLRRAFAVARTLTSLGKDFLRQRAVKSVLSESLKFLGNSAEDAEYKKDKPEAYRHTQLHKLQLEIISGLAGLANDLQLSEESRYGVMAALYKYLRNDRRPELNAAARLAFVELSDTNPGDVCCYLNQLWPLRALPCEGESLSLPEYTDSVLAIDASIAEKWLS